MSICSRCSTRAATLCRSAVARTWRFACETEMADTTAATLFAFDRARLARVADWLAVGVVAAMPWSISISQMLIVAWLVALVPTLDVASVRRELRTPAGGLPALLWLLALIGMLWTN